MVNALIHLLISIMIDPIKMASQEIDKLPKNKQLEMAQLI